MEKFQCEKQSFSENLNNNSKTSIIFLQNSLLIDFSNNSKFSLILFLKLILLHPLICLNYFHRILGM